MKRLLIVLIALGLLVAFAGPASAVKPEKPGKPDGGGPTDPPPCDITVAIDEGSFIAVDDPDDPRRYFTFDMDVSADVLISRSASDLCVEVTVESGRLSDMNVMLIDYPARESLRCGLYWPGAKIDNGYVFKVGFSLDDRGGPPVGAAGFCGSEPALDSNSGALTVRVMPQLHPKTDSATLAVRLGFVPRVP